MVANVVSFARDLYQLKSKLEEGGIYKCIMYKHIKQRVSLYERLCGRCRGNDLCDSGPQTKSAHDAKGVVPRSCGERKAELSRQRCRGWRPWRTPKQPGFQGSTGPRRALPKVSQLQIRESMSL